MGLYRRGEVWWYKFKFRGVTHRATTNERDRQRAAAAAARLRLSIEANQPVATGGGLIVLSELDIERAIAAGASKAQQKTLERDRWAKLLRFFGDLPASQINFDNIQSYIVSRRGDGVRGQTIKREIAALKRGLLIAKRRGWLASVLDEWPTVKNDPPKDSQRGKLHDPDSLRSVVKALPLDVQEGVAFAFLTGLRYAELRRIRMDYVFKAPPGSPTPGLLRLPADKTKNRKERTIGLSVAAMRILAARVERGHSKHRGRVAADFDPLLVFPRVNYRNAIVKACTEAKYSGVITMRDLRHTFMTLGLLETGDIRATMAAGGHTKEATAFMYQHATMDRTASVSLGAEKLLRGHSG
jgi:integrase